MNVNDVTGLMYTGFGIGAMAIGLGAVANMAEGITTKYTSQSKSKTKYCDICKKKVKLPHSHKSDYGGQLFSIDNWKAEKKSGKRHPAWKSKEKGGY